MNRAQQLAAIRTRTPDSIAPDGGLLMFVPVSSIVPRGLDLSPTAA